ncbi:Outer membrane protein assembly factor BamD [Rubripirellula tenax]|uniref:Outer membrane protein assembly factor BamD n=1 Tax=Rubripirellula tenax TaxID=2528015 RepID=A0A5C6EFC3_9BACT|nr:tetratricopeptide repeat protein [Rubripirellula tenax]TWU47215.1 Outer membrane protein assembly factor BamD [Rubripirellula tenax]
MSANFNIAFAMMRRRARVAVWLCASSIALPMVGGCQSLRSPFGPPDDSPYGLTNNDYQDSVNPIAQVSGEEIPGTNDEISVADGSLAEKTKNTTKSVTNFLTGREQEDRERAKQFYKAGDQLFRTAGTQSTEVRKKTYAQAAKQFKKAGESAPGSALEQDSMFMRAESLFFADQLTMATDTYEKLQKQYPRNRHNDRVAARLFSISRYWIDTVKADEGSWIPINFTDSSRPRLDTDGHAIRVLDQIRYDDPTGRLADDATMAAAAEYIRQEKFEEADEFLTDLRETFGDSEHLFLAHLLGLRCKLEIYAGPKYSELVLEEAETLVRQTRQRFPDKMAEPKYGDLVARAAAEIAYHRAERLAQKASFREKRKEYRAAATYYNELLEKYGDTPQAEIARKRLPEIERLPGVPTQRLSWLTTIFPESRKKNPLKLNIPASDQSVEPTETLFR